MNINEKVYELIKQKITNENEIKHNEEIKQNEDNKKINDNTNNLDNLFIKVCLGDATQEEENEYNKMLCSENLSQTLKQCCEMGYDIALKMDKKTIDVNEEIKKLKEDVNFLLNEVEQLKNIINKNENQI